MKRFLIILFFITFAVSAFAQGNESEWTKRSDHEQITISPDAQNIVIDEGYYMLQPFDDVVGYSIYGSKYRKAKARKNWGSFLSIVVAPASAVLFYYGIDEGGPATAILGGAALAGSLAGGIPLWVKGRRQLDWMLDDYARRYAPVPYASSVTVGPTRSGIGLALNF